MKGNVEQKPLSSWEEGDLRERAKLRWRDLSIDTDVDVMHGVTLPRNILEEQTLDVIWYYVTTQATFSYAHKRTRKQMHMHTNAHPHTNARGHKHARTQT